MNKTIKILLIIAVLFINSPALADTTIHLNIETNTGSIYNKDITVSPCDSDNDPTTPDIESAYCALVQSGIVSDWSGLWVNSINGIVNNDNNNGAYWMWLVNLNTNNAASGSCDQNNPYSCSAKQYILKPNDHILFYYNTNPLNISVSNLNPTVGNSLTVTITELGLDSSWNPVWTPSSGAMVTLGTQSCATIADGTCSIVLDTAGSLKAVGSKTSYVSSASVSIEISTPPPLLDTIPPVINLNGNTTESIYVSENYIEKGATAADDVDGNITNKIIITGNVDTLRTGAYVVLFDVSDIAGNKARTVSRTVDVINRPSSGGGGGSFYTPPPIVKIKFDLKKALDFLIAQQKENGSFGENLYTDWIALALAGEDYRENYQEQTTKLIKYFRESKLGNPTLTDYERRAMALMSLGLNPYNIYPVSGGANSENYIEKIIASFDGKQFGDINEDNDDIFALIVLQNAGYAQDEKIISDGILFILSRQKENGSFDESVDMTGAAIEALSAFNQNEQIKNALVKAKKFLEQSQKDNGGWGNASGTAWAIEGILTLSEKPENWIKNGNTPLDYLATIQDTDGGIKNENMQNKIWETAYVASALSGKTWNQVMRKFEKPKETLTPQKVEEKLPKQAMKKNNIKKITPIVKNSNKKDEALKSENLTSQNIGQNTATALTAIADSPMQKTKPQKRNWFLRFLDKIFSIF